ncbi:long-chain-fatty-acid--CoA ligase [Haliovirga abyssi]|uniref:Long-chain-fatty-acid--CoA ligase n=2 Tax=Haliovirga abyssi TaxID=2996794 RepID=A0AAU9DND8_9FUSO|nr:long-chain-fatty-acid--CoA ligase [Haliovirga abyssi]
MEFIKDYNKTAIVYGDLKINYSELTNFINEYSKLTKLSTDEKAIIFMENRPEWIYSFFSIWNCKGVSIPVDFNSNEKELEYVMNDSNAKTIFVSNSSLAKAEKFKDKLNIINVDELNIEKKSNFINIKTPKLDNTAMILYTSGTTGDPKGVMLTVNNFKFLMNSLIKDKMFEKEDTFLALLPLHHILPLAGTLLGPIYVGATIVFSKSLASTDILEALQKNRVTIFIGVPRLLELFHNSIMKKIDESFIAKSMFNLAKNINSIKIRKKIFSKVHDNFGGNIKIMVSGGAKIDKTVAQDFYTLGFPLTEGYGMTETCPIMSYNRRNNIKIGSVGQPVIGSSIKIVDGEIYYKGNNTMKGYYNKPEATKNTITEDGWIKTGDLGYIDKENFIFITGRKKEMIVLPNGKNINPEDIEKKILKISDFIKEIGVIEKNNILHAIIFPDFGKLVQNGVTNINETIKWKIIDKYNQDAPNYKKILKFDIVQEELPKTRLGKIRRFQLESFLNKFIKRDDNIEIKEPESEYYKLLKEYIKENKNIEPFPQNHLELDLGLDSLDIVELQVFIETSFGIKMEQDEIFDNPTLEKLYLYIEGKQGEITNTTVNWGNILKNTPNYDLPKNPFLLFATKWLSMPILKLYFRLKNKNIKNIPTDKQFVLIANHQSFLDGFILVGSLPDKILKNTYFVSKSNYFKSKFMIFFKDHSNIIPIDVNKGLKETLQSLASILKAGKNVVIFPEGTRTNDGSIKEYKKSFAILSKELDIPVVITKIDGAYKAYPRGIIIPRPGNISFNYVDTVYPKDLTIEEIVNISREKTIKY